MIKLSRTQALVLAAAAQWPLTCTVWADGFTQAYLELPNGLQVVKSPTAKGLLERGLLAQSGNEHEGPLEVTAAGHEALAAASTAVAEVSTPGWPNSTSADLMAQRIAQSMTALHARTPDKLEREVAGFSDGVQGAFAAIAKEALDVVHLLHPEVEGHANNATLQVSTRR